MQSNINGPNIFGTIEVFVLNMGSSSHRGLVKRQMGDNVGMSSFRSSIK